MLAAALALASASALAQHIYKHVDEQGRVTYSNEPIKGGKKVDLPEISTVPMPRPSTEKSGPPAPSERDKRLQAVREEISREEKALADSRQALKEGEEKPEVWRRQVGTDKDGKPIFQTGRNVAAYEEKMRALKEEVALHEKRLEALKSELAELEKPQAAPPAPGKR